MGGLILLNGLEPIKRIDFLLMVSSGLLGISLGDTLFFKALIRLGSRLTMLIGAMGPVITIILAIIFLREKPSFLAWTGIFMTLIGINLVLFENLPKERIRINQRVSGIKYAILSILCNSVAIIFAKIGVCSISALNGTFLRFLGGLTGLLFWGGMTRQLKNWSLPFASGRLLKLILLAVSIAIFGGFFLFLFALKYIDASIATILNETTPIFILPLSVFMLKEKISLRSIFGAVIAVTGIALIFIK